MRHVQAIFPANKLFKQGNLSSPESSPESSPGFVTKQGLYNTWTLDWTGPWTGPWTHDCSKATWPMFAFSVIAIMLSVVSASGIKCVHGSMQTGKD